MHCSIINLLGINLQWSKLPIIKLKNAESVKTEN